MYNLAIYKGYNYDIPSSSKLRGIYFSNAKHMLSQLDNVEGVVIHCTKEDSPNKILEMVLTIRRNFSLPIWIRDFAQNDVSKKLNLELGVLGNLDETVSNEEMYIIIENTLGFFNNKKNMKTELNYTNKIELNGFNNSLKIEGKAEISLTQLEYKMLTLLETKVNQAFTYEEIYQSIWQNSEEVDSSVKRYRTSNLVFHIRNKLIENNVNPTILRTVRSVGYLLDSNIDVNNL